MTTRLRGIMRLIGINFVVLLVGVAIVELAFGGWFGANKATLVIAKNVTRTFDVSGLYKSANPVIEYRRDKYGLRGAYPSPAEIDILAIGGSTTNEIFMAQENTWTGRLGDLLSGSGRRVHVVNAGVDGQSTVGLLRDFELWFPTIPALKPKYVLAYVGINSLAVVKSGNMNAQDYVVAKRRVFRQIIHNNSAIYALIRNIQGMIVAKQANLIHVQQNYDGTNWTAPATPPDVDGWAAAHAQSLEAFAGTVKELAKRIRALGAEPIFVTQQKATYRIRDGQVLGKPRADGGVDLGDYEGLTAINRTTMRACREASAICIDLASTVRFEDGDQYDGLHTTPSGSEKVARIMYGALKDVLKFDRPR